MISLEKPIQHCTALLVTRPSLCLSSQATSHTTPEFVVTEKSLAPSTVKCPFKGI